MKRTMLDIEALGTAPGFIVLSIGAVSFDETGRIHSEFYVNIDKTTSIAAGLKLDPVTAAWWRQQSKEAQAALLVDPKPLAKALDAFRIWFFKQDAPTVWCQGANFDAPVLEGAFDAAGVEVPWKFWNVRDTRTVYDLFDFDTRTVARGGAKHNALDDARHQVRLLTAALRNGRKPVAALAPKAEPVRDDKHFDDAMANDVFDMGDIFE